MYKHITVIDVKYGTKEDGFAVRFGDGLPTVDRLAHCISIKSDGNIGFYKNAGHNNYTYWESFDTAVKYAIELQKSYPDYKVRVDCTIT